MILLYLKTSEEIKMNDLFDNPMVDMAKKALTPEQIEEYKKIGEYMYQTDYSKITEFGSKAPEATEDELFVYASQALRSGLDTSDLSGKEISILSKRLGEKWYETFGVDKPEEMTIDGNSVLACSRKISRQERRLQERLLAKQRKNK